MTGRIYGSGPISLSQIKPVHERQFNLSSYYKCLPDPFPSDTAEPISFSSFYGTSNETSHRWVFKPENGFNQSYTVPQGVTGVTFTALGSGGNGGTGHDDVTYMYAGAGGDGAVPTSLSFVTNPVSDTINISLSNRNLSNDTAISTSISTGFAFSASSAYLHTAAGGSYSVSNGAVITKQGALSSNYSTALGVNAGSRGPSVMPYYYTYGIYRIGAEGGGSEYSAGGSSYFPNSYNGEYGGGGAGSYSSGIVYQLKTEYHGGLQVQSPAYHKTSIILQNMPYIRAIDVTAPQGQVFNTVRVKCLGYGGVQPQSMLENCVAGENFNIITNLSGQTTPTSTGNIYDTGFVNVTTARTNTFNLPDNVTFNYSTVMVEIYGAWGGSAASNAGISVHSHELNPKKVYFQPQYWQHGYWNNNWWWGPDLWNNRWTGNWWWWGYWGDYGYWDGYGYSYWSNFGWWDYYSVYSHIDNYQNWDITQFLDGDYSENYWRNSGFYYYNWWYGNNSSWDYSWHWNGSQWTNMIPVIHADNYASFEQRTGRSSYYLSYYNSGLWGWDNDLVSAAGIIYINPSLDGFKSLPAGKYIMLGGTNYSWGNYGWLGQDDFYGWTYYSSWTPNHLPFIVTGGTLKEIVTIEEGKQAVAPCGFTLYNVSQDVNARIETVQPGKGGHGVAFISEWHFDTPGTWYFTTPQGVTEMDVTICGDGGTTISRTINNLVNGLEISVTVGSASDKESNVDPTYNGSEDPDLKEPGGVTSNPAKVVLKTKNVDYHIIKASY